MKYGSEYISGSKTSRLNIIDLSEQVIQNMQIHSPAQHKEKYKWKEALPVAFGPHQV